MNKELNISRIVTAALLFALLLWMVIGIAVPAVSMFRTPEADRMLVYGQASRLYRAPAAHGNGSQLKPSRPVSSVPAGSADVPESTAPTVKPTLPTTVPSTAPSTAPTQAPTVPTTKPTIRPTVPTTVPTVPSVYDPRPGIPAFTAADEPFTSTWPMGGCIYTFSKSDRAALLQQRLELDLDNGQPAVLIIHTHATECFTGDTDKNYAAYRNPDNSVNMVSIGTALKEALEQAGIVVIHDTDRHDYYNYDGAYDSSRKAIQEYLKEYPTIQLVLDLHRDSFDGGKGATAVTINGEKVAQPMLYVGTNSRSYNPNWRESMSYAMKLQATMERSAPGLTRNTMVSGGVYNQDLLAPSLLVECGASGDTRDEVLRSIPYLARAIIALANGAN